MRVEYFQLIDRVTEISVTEKTISAEAAVPQTSTIFEGHFPGFALLPGVLLVETMAQACGWLVAASHAFEQMPFLVQIKEAKLRRFVEPGQLLVIAGKLLHEGSGFAVCGATIASGGQAVCSAELMFKILPFPNAEMRAHMTKVARILQLAVDAVDHD
jgi:3-hydroxyacyl-[acyl-carrier-protein] dehydratase